MRDGGNRGQRFAAESEAGNRFEIFEVGDFAGRVPLQGKFEFGTRYSVAIVSDANLFDPAIMQLHRDFIRASVKAVFEQFLERRCGALDHFTSGYLADQQVVEYMDL